GFHILEMDEIETPLVFLEQSDRVLTAVNDPKDVHLKRDELGLGLRHQQVEEILRSVRLKLVTVRVVEKPDAVFGERLATFVENLRCFTAILFSEISAMGDPCAAGILGAQRLCFFR